MSDQKTQPLKDRAAFCRHRIELCEEIVEQLQGYAPDDFKFTFTIKNAVIAGFDIGEDESWFIMAFFLGWIDLYRKELKRLTAQMSAA